MKYEIGDIVKLYSGEKYAIGIILRTRMWDKEVDYKVLICGRPGEDIWVLERLILGKLDEI
jgi:hypothetical protein